MVVGVVIAPFWIFFWPQHTVLCKIQLLLLLLKSYKCKVPHHIILHMKRMTTTSVDRSSRSLLAILFRFSLHLFVYVILVVGKAVRCATIIAKVNAWRWRWRWWCAQETNWKVGRFRSAQINTQQGGRQRERDIDDFILMRSMCLSLWMRKSYASASVCEEKQKQKQKKDPEKWFSISIHVKLKVHFCDSIVTIHLFHYNMLTSTSFCLWINKWMCWKSFFPKAVASPLHEHTMHRLLNESNCSFHLNKARYALTVHTENMTRSIQFSLGCVRSVYERERAEK